MSGRLRIVALCVVIAAYGAATGDLTGTAVWLGAASAIYRYWPDPGRPKGRTKRRTKGARMATIDLNAARAERAKKTVTHEIVVGDDTIVVPGIEEWPLQALEDIERGQVTEAFQMVLEPAEWKRLASHGLTGGDLKTIIDGISEAQGLGGSGNSSGSTRTSGSTGKKSKRT